MGHGIQGRGIQGRGIQGRGIEWGHGIEGRLIGGFTVLDIGSCQSDVYQRSELYSVTILICDPAQTLTIQYT